MVHELDEVDRILTNLAVLPYAINRTQGICGTCYVAISPYLLQQRKHININNTYQYRHKVMVTAMGKGSFHVNSTNGPQVSYSNIAQQIPKITLVSIMKACQFLGCNSEYFWRYSLSNFFVIAFLPSRLKC